MGIALYSKRTSKFSFPYRAKGEISSENDDSFLFEGVANCVNINTQLTHDVDVIGGSLSEGTWASTYQSGGKSSVTLSSFTGSIQGFLVNQSTEIKWADLPDNQLVYIWVRKLETSAISTLKDRTLDAQFTVSSARPEGYILLATAKANTTTSKVELETNPTGKIWLARISDHLHDGKGSVRLQLANMLGQLPESGVKYDTVGGHRHDGSDSRSLSGIYDNVIARIAHRLANASSDYSIRRRISWNSQSGIDFANNVDDSANQEMDVLPKVNFDTYLFPLISGTIEGSLSTGIDQTYAVDHSSQQGFRISETVIYGQIGYEVLERVDLRTNTKLGFRIKHTGEAAVGPYTSGNPGTNDFKMTWFRTGIV